MLHWLINPALFTTTLSLCCWCPVCGLFLISIPIHGVCSCRVIMLLLLSSKGNERPTHSKSQIIITSSCWCLATKTMDPSHNLRMGVMLRIPSQTSVMNYYWINMYQWYYRTTTSQQHIKNNCLRIFEKTDERKFGSIFQKELWYQNTTSNLRTLPN